MSVTIPMLPCRDILEIQTFYQNLGFTKTYLQQRPNPYIVVKRGAIELHFFGVEGFDPEKSLGTCAVRVDDADELYRAFAEGVRAHLGKLPATGIPRITRPRKKMHAVYGFSVIDPGGNWIRVSSAAPKSTAAATSKLGQALEAAASLGDNDEQYAQAARILDNALRNNPSAPAHERVSALVYRAELAVTMGDTAAAATRLAELQSLPLTAADRDAVSAEIERAKTLTAELPR
jgi:hypothetical protein